MSLTTTDPKVEAFFDGVRRSGLMDAVAIDEYISTQPRIANVQQAATRMVRDGLLSTFQAKMVLEGKVRGFVANGKFRVLELVAVGGMGAVYLCEHMLMRRPVAIKVLPKDALSRPGSGERFLREARAVASLDHPNLVRAFDLDKLGAANQYCLVMEYVDGVNLHVLVEKAGPLSVTRAVDHIAQAAGGLGYLHEAGMVHRDIKPANVLVNRQGTVKLLDLGLARFFEETDNLTRQHAADAILGTADYIAPEQALGSTVDPRADIYSLGATLYFLLAGHPPFPDGTASQKLMWHQTREPEPIHRVRPSVPAGLSAIIAKMMAKKAADRYPDARSVVEALKPYLSGPVAPPEACDLPQHCPLVQKLLASAKPGSTSTPVPTWALSSSEFSIPTPPTGAPAHETVANAIDLTDVPTWRGRKLAPSATSTNATGTMVTTKGAMQRPARGRWTMIGGLVVVAGLLAAAVAANQANRPPQVPTASTPGK